MKLSIVIPVYNEINTLLELLRRVQQSPYDKEIIIVDDCSTDGTVDLLKGLKDCNIKVLYNEKNRGKGFAIRRGFENVSGDIVIIQDADLEYYPDEYPQLIQKIVEGKADVVYGTRFQGAHRVFNYYHYIGNTFLNFLANILYNTNLSDLMTCYKAFKRDVIKMMHLRADGFGIEAEMTAQIFKRRLKVYEVPISYDGRDYDEGKKISWRDFFISLYWLLRCKYEVYDVGEHVLYRMRLMKNNNKWVFESVNKYLGERVLEVGSGIGGISRYLSGLRKELIVLSDINDRYLEYLKYRFLGNPKIKIVHCNMAQFDRTVFQEYRLDTVMAVNVLEHVKDDEAALKNVHAIIAPGGRLVLLVPALRWLYGSYDRHLDHYRRYEKNELIDKLQRCGFSVEKIYFHNSVSVFGWYINARLLRRKEMSAFQMALLDRFIPVFAAFEHVIRVPFGLSLIAICKKENA